MDQLNNTETGQFVFENQVWKTRAQNMYSGHTTLDAKAQGSLALYALDFASLNIPRSPSLDFLFF